MTARPIYYVIASFIVVSLATLGVTAWAIRAVNRVSIMAIEQIADYRASSRVVVDENSRVINELREKLEIRPADVLAEVKRLGERVDALAKQIKEGMP